MPKKAVIDGDVIRYSVGFAANEDPVAYCLHSVKIQINSILEAVDADEYIIFLTGKGNFREEVATTVPYKGNRDSSHKPVHYEAITEYLISKYKAQVIEGMEADDAMSIMQYEDPDNVVICTIDKDLLMVPGQHYNWRKGEHKTVSELEGARWFWTQMLIGDSTDNIMGCGTKKPGVYKSGKKKGEAYEKRSGIGPKAAEKLLEGATSYDQMKVIVGMQYATLDEGAAFSDPESAMLENGQLLWMLRHEEEMWSLDLDPTTPVLKNSSYTSVKKKKVDTTDYSEVDFDEE